MWPFRCKHPADFLRVECEATQERVERPDDFQDGDLDFDHVTYHLNCGLCGKAVPVKYARVVGA